MPLHGSNTVSVTLTITAGANGEINESSPVPDGGICAITASAPNDTATLNPNQNCTVNGQIVKYQSGTATVTGDTLTVSETIVDGSFTPQNVSGNCTKQGSSSSGSSSGGGGAPDAAMIVTSFTGTWTSSDPNITLTSQTCGPTTSASGNQQDFLPSVVLTEDSSGNVTGIDSNNGNWSGAVVGSTSAPTGFQLSYVSTGNCSGTPGGSYAPVISCTATDPTTCTASGLDCQSCSALGTGNSISATMTGTLILTR